MPGPSINDTCDAQYEIAHVENALIDGYLPIGIIGSHQKTALREAAGRMRVEPQSLRRRIGIPGEAGTHLRRFGLRVQWELYRAPAPEPVADEAPAAPEVIVPDRRMQALRDELAATKKALRDAQREANTADIIREVVGAIADTPREPPEWVAQAPARERHKAAPEVPVTIWSDFHLGEVVERTEVNGANEYSMGVAEERIHRLVETTIKLCRDNHTGVYPGIVVNLGGDMVSGGLHPELKATDEEESIPAAIKAIDWIAAGLTRMADEFGRVYVPGVCGNHGRNTAKPEFKRYYRKNFDWLILQMLARHFADDPRIHFDVRPSNDVAYRVFNERYLLVHGDMLGVKGGDGIIGSIGPITRGEVKKSGQSSALGFGFDKILMGHWHQRLWLPRATVNNALKGFDEYAKNQLGAKPDRPTQALWFVHPAHGQTAHWDVYVDRKPEASGQWIAAFQHTGEAE